MENAVEPALVVLGDSTNVLASPPQSLKVTRRSRSRRSNRSRSTLADSPGGEPSDLSDALASRLRGHVDSAAALRLAASEVSAQLGQLSYDALRERIDQLARLAAQLHTELHSEWRCALLSTADGAAAARAAAKLDAVEMHGAEGEVEAPAARPSADEYAGFTSSPFDETLPLALPLLALAPVAEVEDAAADSSLRAKACAAETSASGAEAGAEHVACAAFERPPPVIVPPPASAHPPCTPPAIRSAPVERARCGGMPPSPALRPAALSCGGGGLSLPTGFGAAAGALGGAPAPFMPLTISAFAVQRARASAAARPPLGTPGGGLRTPRGSHASTPRGSHAGPIPSYAASTPRQSQRASVTPTAARSAAVAGWPVTESWGRGAAAAAFVQARARGWLARKRWLAPLRRQLKRAAVAAELAASEARFCALLRTLVDTFVRPLEASGAAGERAAREIFSNARVLANVSSLFLAALKPAVAELRPARAVAAVLQAHVPLFKTYRPYVAAFSRACAALDKARGSGALGALLREGEAKAGCSLDSLLIQPIQRVPRYKLLVERLLQLTEPAAPEHAQLQEVLLRVGAGHATRAPTRSSARPAAALVSRAALT